MSGSFQPIVDIAAKDLCRLRKSVARATQRLHAPKSWIGFRGVILFKVECDTLDFATAAEYTAYCSYARARANAESNRCGSIHNRCNGSRLRPAKLKASML